jgi:heat shock protein HtpX
MGAFGLYTHIRANRWRSILLLAGLFLLVYVLLFAGFLAMEALRGGPSLARLMERAAAATIRWAPVASVGTLMWVGIGYAFHQGMIDGLTEARAVSRQEEPELYNLLENLCISRGMPMPQLKIIETEALNAYASGMSEKQYAVTVTRGLMQALDRDELEAVLAHELTHIRNGDVRLMVIAVIIVGVLSFVGEIVFRWLARGPRIRIERSDDDGGKSAAPAAAALLIAVVLIVVAWFLSQVLRFALSRSREYLADAGAAELTKNPDAMISALRKISGHAELPGVPSGVMEMCIENERSGVMDLFATHPPIPERIAALVTFAGGQEAPESRPRRLPGPAPAPALETGKPQPWGRLPAGPWGPVDISRPDAGPWAR